MPAAEWPTIRRKTENRVEKAKMEELTVKNCKYKWVMAVTSIGNYAETKKMPGRRKSSGRGADRYQSLISDGLPTRNRLHSRDTAYSTNVTYSTVW